MSKQKIMAIVIAAVVVIAGVAVAVPVLRNRVTSKTEETTTAPVAETVTADDTTVVEDETETIEETVTDDEGVPVTRKDGKVVTTIRVVKKTATTKAASKTTTKSSGTGTINTGSKTVDKALYSMENLAVLGYKYNSDGDYFYTDDKDCWQEGYGYNEVYDQAAQFGVMFIDKLRIRFDYEDKAFMVQLWKGQYGWVFVGGEIGVYTTDDFKTSEIDSSGINHYDCADKSDWLNMSMTMYWDENGDGSYEKLFSRPYTKYWWCTGFKYGTLNKFNSPISELIMKARVTFKSTTMANLFTKGMKQSGFGSASSSSSLGNDTIYQSGADVYFRWRSVYRATFTDVASTNSGTVSSDDTTATTEATTAKAGTSATTTSILNLFTTSASSTTTTTKAASGSATTTTTKASEGEEKPN